MLALEVCRGLGSGVRSDVAEHDHGEDGDGHRGDGADARGRRRDRLTDFARAVTGAYYFVPSTEALAKFAAEPTD